MDSGISFGQIVSQTGPCNDQSALLKIFLCVDGDRCK